MDYIEKIKELPTQKLIHIIENPTNYKKDFWDTTIKIFDSYNLEFSEIQDIVYEENRQLASKTIEKLDPLNEDLIFHHSYFLSKDELHSIYQEELLKYMEKKDGFRFNVWLYALGG